MRPDLPRFVRALVGVALFGVTLSTHAQNLIRNAGFESPLYDSDGDGRIDGAALDDWNMITGGTTGSVIRNNYNSGGMFLPAQVGVQQYFMEINGQSATIQQIGLSLTAGVTYYFSFYLSGLQNGPNAAHAEIVASFTDGTDPHAQTFTLLTTGWAQQEFSFVPANTANYTLSLTSPAGFYSNLDDLRLDTTPAPPPGSAVPEPAGYAAIAGLAALAAGFRRRQRSLNCR